MGDNSKIKDRIFYLGIYNIFAAMILVICVSAFIIEYAERYFPLSSPPPMAAYNVMHESLEHLEDRIKSGEQSALSTYSAVKQKMAEYEEDIYDYNNEIVFRNNVVASIIIIGVIIFNIIFWATMHKLVKLQTAIAEKDLNNKKRISAALSHDFKSMISTARDLVEVSEEEWENKDQLIVQLQMLQTAVIEFSYYNAMDNTDIKSLISSNIETVNIVDYLSELYMTLCNYETVYEDLEIECDLEAEPMNVDLSIKDMDRAINNIVVNAILHGKCTKVELIYKKQNHFAEIVIYNNGEVIPAKDRDSIFEAYVSGDDKEGRTKIKNASSGLGTYIAKKIIEYHKGKIEVMNVENGAGFRIYLPESGKYAKRS